MSKKLEFGSKICGWADQSIEWVLKMFGGKFVIEFKKLWLRLKNYRWPRKVCDWYQKKLWLTIANICEWVKKKKSLNQKFLVESNKLVVKPKEVFKSSKSCGWPFEFGLVSIKLWLSPTSLVESGWIRKSSG